MQIDRLIIKKNLKRICVFNLLILFFVFMVCREISKSKIVAISRDTSLIDSVQLSKTTVYSFILQNDTAIQKLKFIKLKGDDWNFELSILNKQTKKSNIIKGSLHCTYIDDIVEQTEEGFSSHPYCCSFTKNGIEYNFDLKEGKTGLIEAIVSTFNPITRKELDDFVRLPMKLEKKQTVPIGT